MCGLTGVNAACVQLALGGVSAYSLEMKLLKAMPWPHPTAACLGMRKRDHRTHFPFPLPKNPFVFLADICLQRHFSLHFSYNWEGLEKADSYISFLFQVNIKFKLTNNFKLK